MLNRRIRRVASLFVAICVGLAPAAVANAETAPGPQTPSAAQGVQQTANIESVGSPTPETQPFGVRGFLIKKGLRLVSSMLRNGKVGEVVEEARKRGFIDDDMARAISSKPNQIADAIDNTLHQAGEFEEGIKEKLRVNLEPVVGQQLALGIAEALMFVFL